VEAAVVKSGREKKGKKRAREEHLSLDVSSLRHFRSQKRGSREKKEMNSELWWSFSREKATQQHKKE